MSNSQFLIVVFIVSNFFFCLHTQYVGTPESTANLKAVLTHSYQLKCEYKGADGDGQFLDWYRENITVSSEKPGHYLVRQNATESTLIIQIFVKADEAIKFWQVKTNKPGFEEPTQCRFDQIPLKSSPQGIQTNFPNEKIDSVRGSIRRSEDQSLNLTCRLDPKPEILNDNDIQWDFSKDGQLYTSLPADVIKSNNQLIIEHVKKLHHGYYRCTMNDISFTVLLRVKDQLAALWPFIGIVGVVLVLVIIILIFEKRQISNKKNASADDDDQDQAKDPLVRTTTNTSDSDNRKRTVNA